MVGAVGKVGGAVGGGGFVVDVVGGGGAVGGGRGRVGDVVGGVVGGGGGGGSVVGVDGMVIIGCENRAIPEMVFGRSRERFFEGMIMKKYYYHFTKDTLRDGRPIPPIGQWLVHKGPLVPCKSGLHASEHPFDAVYYAPGSQLHLVELAGRIIPHGGTKVVSRRRKIVKSFDAEPLLQAFSRRVALDAILLWPDAPPVVVEYLKTGDESLREASEAAARSAATWNRSEAAARSAAVSASALAEEPWAASGAWSTAVSAVEAASWNKSEEAAWSSADAKVELYRKWFLEEVENAFSKIPPLENKSGHP
jgi:hypothetical protein